MTRWLIVMATVRALVFTLARAAAVLTPSRAAHAAPEPVNTSGSSTLDPIILTALNTVGDDTFAVVDLTTVLPDPSSTQHYGPYPSGSGDSGTCGPDWAQDTFDRHFTDRKSVV